MFRFLGVLSYCPLGFFCVVRRKTAQENLTMVYLLWEFLVGMRGNVELLCV